MTNIFGSGRSFSPDLHPDDPWSWTRVVYHEIEGWPGYCVGTDGSVWTQKIRLNFMSERWRQLKEFPSVTGYLLVKLYNNGSNRTRPVYRFVLETFIGPCPEGKEACHNNGKRTDNNITNLRWDTRQANMDDMRRHGTTPKGSRSAMAILTEADVVEMRQLRRTGMQVKEIAKLFSVDATNICRAISGHHWTHVDAPTTPPRNIHFLNPDHIPEIFRLRAEGWKQAEIADRFGYDSSTISRLLGGKTHRKLASNNVSH
jgi:hypothetical protein